MKIIDPDSAYVALIHKDDNYLWNKAIRVPGGLVVVSETDRGLANVFVPCTPEEINYWLESMPEAKPRA